MISLRRALSMSVTRERSKRSCASSSVPAFMISSTGRLHGQSYGQRKLKTSEELQYERNCRTLGVSENCQDESVVRDAYISLAKRFHPDSGSPEASASKFQEIDTAYRNFLKYFADFRHNRHKIEGEYGLYYKQKKGRLQEQQVQDAEDEVESPDIKHTAPQHRQYLSYDGVGSGTPRQREKQYQKWRATKAVENVLEHRMEQVVRNSGEEVKELVKDQKAAKKIKTGIGVERLVEDMIQDAMARGDFDNLSGKGKPLNPSNAYNPYIDFTTHKLNQVLIDNGFAPEWIILEKEIKEEGRRLRRQLNETRHIFGEALTPEQLRDWEENLEAMKPDCDKLNKMILKYNLTVPSLHKQLIGFQLEKEASKSLANFDPDFHLICKEKHLKTVAEAKAARSSGSNTAYSGGDTFLNSLMSLFKM